MLTVIAASAGAIRTVTRPLLSKKNVTSNSCSDLLWVLAACDTGRSMLAGLEVALQIRPTAVTQVTTLGISAKGESNNQRELRRIWDTLGRWHRPC